MSVAEAAIAAFGDNLASPGRVRSAMERLVVLGEDLRARRHLHDDVGAVSPWRSLAHALLAVPGQEMLLVAEIDEGVEVLHALDDHLATLAAIAAVRPTALDELLAPEGDEPVAAFAGADIDLRLVEEFMVVPKVSGPAVARWLPPAR